MSIGLQFVWLFILSIPVACVAWTITHEEGFREPREFCQRHSGVAHSFFRRKFFYLFTCEYCFSHYVAALFLVLSTLVLRLAGISRRLFRAGVGRKPVYECLQPSPARHQA